MFRERPEVLVKWNGALSAGEVLGARGLRRFGWHVAMEGSESVGRVQVRYPKRSEELSDVELACLEQLSSLDLSIREKGSSRLGRILAQLEGLQVLQLEHGVDGAVLRQLEDSPNLQRLVLWHAVLTDSDLAVLKKFPRLDALQINAESLGSRGMEHICKAKKLACVWLWGGHFEDRSLEPFKGLPHLEELYLRSARFEPGATEPLKNLKKLKILDLCASNIDDTGVVPLLSLPVLEELKLSETRISDKGLLQLAEIKSLRRLSFSWFPTAVTDQGRKRFRDLRPDVVFNE